MKNENNPVILGIRNLSYSYEPLSGYSNGIKKPGRRNSDVIQIEALDFSAGGCHAIIGPNGSGKTTLLKLVAGLLSPKAGTITKSSDAVLVHQHPYLLSGSVYANIAYGLKVKKLPKKQIKTRVRAALGDWGLEHLADRPASRLSGGEMQRTAIARAMVLQPEILLLDEPTANIDPDNINQMETLIAEISATGTTVILSTHHIDFAYRTADTILRLNRGRPENSEENVVSGRIAERGESLNVFEAEGGGRLFCPGRDGDFRKAVFSENDIILADQHISSSARNILESVITDIGYDGDDVIVGLEAGFNFRARISSISAAELHLERGREIFAILKSSAIRLY